MSIEILLEKSQKNNYIILNRYLKFISSRAGIKKIGETHYHHILPKCKTFYPQYKNLKEHPWNGIHLTHREHYIAHWMLARAFPKTSQFRAFYNMTNTLKKKRSRLYEEALLYHKEKVIAMTQDPARNEKISNALKGRPKTTEHKQKLIGHPVTDETRQKLREHNLGKKASIEARKNMSISRKGKKRKPHDEQGKTKISLTKKMQNRKWFNNGIQSMLLTAPIDDTWVLGRLPWK